MLDNPKASTQHRPYRKRLMHVVRRGHMYLGLLLFPWALLYGVSGYLFNHPTHFAEQSGQTYGAPELAGTSIAKPADKKAMAEKVVAELGNRFTAGGYKLGDGEVSFNREFAFGTAKSGEKNVSFLYDVHSPGGTVRVQAQPKERKAKTKAPFAIGAPEGKGQRGGAIPKGGQRGGGTGGPRVLEEGLFLDDPLHERLKAAIAGVLEKMDLPSTDIVITSIPDLVFSMVDAEGVIWKTTWNAQTGAVGGTQLDEEERAELSIRRFLLRLHTAHGYPGQMNAKWYWAVIVDVMSFVLVFWGVSGLFMWWQIRRTRYWGVLAMGVSAGLAIWLAMGMHSYLTQG